MATTTYNTIFKLKRKNAADWTNDYLLQEGEPGFEIDTGKLKIGDGIKTWSQLPYIQGTSGQDAGTSFEVGENMILENGVLKAKYGEQVETFGKIFKQNLDGSDVPDGLDGEDPTIVEESNCIILQTYDTTEDNSIVPIITSGNIELQINYDNIEDTDNNIKFNDIVHYDTESAPFSFYWSGNETGMKYFLSVLLEDPDDSLLSAWAEEESKWFMVQIDMSPTGFSAALTVIGLPLNYYTNENEEEVVSIQLNANTTTPYKLPAAALSAGTGIKIDENTGKINLSFGEYKKTEFDGHFPPGSSEITPSTKAVGNLYCWYSDGEHFINWEENNSPEPYSNRNAIINFFYSKGSKQYDTKLNYGPQNYQTNLTDEYYTIPFYFDKPINLLTDASNSYKIELKEMQYQDNILYTVMSMLLDTNNPLSNIFYAATVNTNDSVNTIMNNGSINPIDDEEPAILFILLDQPQANQVYILAFSNTNTLGINPEENKKMFIQGIEYPTYIQLPPNWLNSATCTGAKGSIVLGEYNRGYEKESQSIILGNHNQTTNSLPQLVLGKYNDFQSRSYFQIGNGDEYNKRNIFEVGNSHVKINGTLLLNGQELTIKPMITNPGLANQENINDYAAAYQDLANKFNNLIYSLQNAEYMYD